MLNQFKKKENKSKKLIIEMLSLPAGCGKTYISVEEIAFQLKTSNKRFLIPLPTIEFAEEWIKNLTKLNVSFIETINSNTKQNSDNVCKNIEAAILRCNQEDSDCRVIIISHNALCLSNFGSIVNGWTVIIDESLTTHEFHGFNIAVSKTNFDLAISKEEIGDYYYITKSEIKDATKHDDYVKGKHDQLNKLKNYDCFIKKDVYERILAKTDMEKEEKNNITMLALLRPDFLYDFESVKILAANFEDSMLYEHWSNNHDVKFINDVKLLAKITRPKEHTNGHLLTIKYFDIPLFSKNLAEKKLKNGKTVCQHMLDVMFDILDNNFCYAVNEGFKHTKPLSQKIEKMPVKSMGQNKFAKYSKIGYLVQLNLDKTKLSMLEDFSLSNDAVWRAINGENSYQTITRISIRNPAILKPALAVVADQKQAFFNAEKFPGCNLEPIDCSFLLDIVDDVIPFNREKKTRGRPKQALSNKEEQAKKELKKKVDRERIAAKRAVAKK